MAERLILCPDGTYAIFGSIVDEVISYNMSREEVIEEKVAEAAQVARASMQRRGSTASLRDARSGPPKKSWSTSG